MILEFRVFKRIHMEQLRVFHFAKFQSSAINLNNKMVRTAHPTLNLGTRTILE